MEALYLVLARQAVDRRRVAIVYMEKQEIEEREKY